MLSLTEGKPHTVRTASAELTAPRISIANNGFARQPGFARDRVFTIST